MALYGTAVLSRPIPTEPNVNCLAQRTLKVNLKADANHPDLNLGSNSWLAITLDFKIVCIYLLLEVFCSQLNLYLTLKKFAFHWSRISRPLP